MIPPTLLNKPLAPEKINLLNEEEKRLYTIQKGKYDTYLRILEKKRVQQDHPVDKRFEYNQVQMLLEGKHHEEDEADDEENLENNDMKYLSRDENFHQHKIEMFEQEARIALAATRVKHRPPQTYIPETLRKELDLPGDLEENQVNFNEVIKKDCSIKRVTPIWSGQEVLDIGLNMNLSYWVIAKINAVRVWPKGGIGFLKKL